MYHEVIVSELQSRSGSWAGPVHAEALMLFWDPAALVREMLSNVDNSREKSGKEKKRGGGANGKGRGGYRWHNMEREKRELQHSQNLVHLELDMPSAKQALYIRFWGSYLFWCYGLLLHKSVHYDAYEEGYSKWNICWLMQADVE